MNKEQKFIEKMNNLTRPVTPIEGIICVFYKLTKDEFLNLPLGKIQNMHLYLDNQCKVSTTKGIEYYCIKTLVPNYLELEPKSYEIVIENNSLGIYQGLTKVDACIAMFRANKELSLSWFNIMYLTYKGCPIIFHEIEN